MSYNLCGLQVVIKTTPICLMDVVGGEIIRLGEFKVDVRPVHKVMQGLALR